MRRMLCGDGLETAAAHADVEAVPGAGAGGSAGADVRNDATAHVTAAVARGRGIRGGEVVWGETAVVNGEIIGAWALVSRVDGSVMAVGVSVPVGLAESMPARGAGPAGAVASLDFPDVARQSTYFDHFELHSEPQGHVSPPGALNPNRNAVPHFDYHFYGIPEAQVWDIPLLRPPPALPAVPADRLPAGFTQPGFSQLQMGRHAGPAWQLTDPNPLSTVTLAGFLPDASRMHFIEPMISRDVLLQRASIPLEVPMPQAFDRDMLYPTRSETVFHGGAHHFIYSDFIDTDPTTPAPSDAFSAAVAGGGAENGAELTASARSNPIPDPVGDILPTYNGVIEPGMDVVSHQVTLAGDRMIFFGQMAGPVAPTQDIGGIYLFGVDRGRGTPRFLNPAAGAPIGPNVKWDLIVRVNPDGTGRVNNSLLGVVADLDPSDIRIDGNNLVASVPLTLLQSGAALPPEQWTYNLWPRNGVGLNVQVSDLAPDDGNSPVRVLSRPGSAGYGQAGPSEGAPPPGASAVAAAAGGNAFSDVGISDDVLRPDGGPLALLR